MSKLKPLESLAEDVQVGDLVRIQLPRSDYVGYIWNFKESVTPFPGSDNDFPSHLKDADIIFSGLNPHGNTENLINEIQYVGINIKSGKLGDEPIKGYEVLRRNKSKE